MTKNDKPGKKIRVAILRADTHSYYFGSMMAPCDALFKPKVCHSPEEMAGAVDLAFISDCDGGGGDHLKLAAPFLRRGIPTFVDKPFALTLPDAQAMGTLPLEFLHLHLRNGRDVVVLNSSMDVFPESCSFFVAAYTKLGAIHSGPIGDPQFIPGGMRLLRHVRDMVWSGKPPVPYEDLLEPIAVVEASQMAQATGQRVSLHELA